MLQYEFSNIQLINKQAAEEKEEKLQQRWMRYTKRTSWRNAEETSEERVVRLHEEALGRDRLSTAKAHSHNGITFD